MGREQWVTLFAIPWAGGGLSKSREVISVKTHRVSHIETDPAA